jgi:hypothetical protein
MPDPQRQPLALPMLMQSGATPTPAIPYWLGQQQLDKLRRDYEIKKKRLAQLSTEQSLRARGQNWSTSAMFGVTDPRAVQGAEQQQISDAEVNLEIQRLQREIKAMEQQHGWLNAPYLIPGDWIRSVAADLQQQVKSGAKTPEQAGQEYSQAQSVFSGQTAPQPLPQQSTPWQQPGQPTTGSGQSPQSPQISSDPWASYFGFTDEQLAAAPRGFRESLPYVATGQQPPQRFDPAEAMMQYGMQKAFGGGNQEPNPWWWDKADPSQQRAYLNMQAGKQNFDPMQFFQQRMEQSSANKKWQQEMALAERELAARMADQQAQQAYQQQALAQAQQQFEAQLAAEQAYRQQQIEQARREMAAQIGTNLNAQQSQNWANALPYVLPYGTTTPPGFEAGGPVNTLAAFAGQQNYTPMQISPSPAPERSEMEALIKRAIDAFK